MRPRVGGHARASVRSQIAESMGDVGLASGRNLSPRPKKPRGTTDAASAHGAGDCKIEPCQGRRVMTVNRHTYGRLGRRRSDLRVTISDLCCGPVGSISPARGNVLLAAKRAQPVAGTDLSLRGASRDGLMGARGQAG